MTTLIDAVVSDFDFLLEDDVMSALLTAASARELLESRKQEALAAISPFIDLANEAIQTAIKQGKDTVTLALEGVPEAARPMAFKQLEDSGYLCVANDASLSIVKVRF